MKKTLLLALILWAGSISANNVTDSLKTNVTPVYYNRMFLGAGVVGADGESLLGLELGYTRGIRLAAETQHYLEVGAGVEYLTNSNNSYLTAAIPVNYTYRIPVGTKGLTLSPFGGAGVRLFIGGEMESRISMGLQTGLNVDYGRFVGGVATHFNVVSSFAIGFTLRVGVRF